MASFGHIAVGLAAGRRFSQSEPKPRVAWTMLYFCTLAMAPDLDGLAFRFGIPDAGQFGHRGAAHSLFAAVLIGTLFGSLARFLASPPPAPSRGPSRWSRATVSSTRSPTAASASRCSGR